MKKNQYEIIIKDQFGENKKKIVLGGLVFVKEGKYWKDEIPFFYDLSGGWKLVEKCNNILKYRYENKQNFTFKKDNKTTAENLTVLIDRDTGIPIGASWFSIFLKTGTKTQHYLELKDTNIRGLKNR